MCQQMQHKTATNVRLEHSLQPHPRVGYITTGAASSNEDNDRTPTDRYAHSASMLTSTHTYPATMPHSMPLLSLLPLHAATTLPRRIKYTSGNRRSRDAAAADAA